MDNTQPYRFEVGVLCEGSLTYLPIVIVWKESGRRVRLDLDRSVFDRLGKDPRADYRQTIEEVLLKNWVEATFQDSEEWPTGRDYLYVIRQSFSDKILTAQPTPKERSKILELDAKLLKLSESEWEHYLDELDEGGPGVGGAGAPGPPRP